MVLNLMNNLGTPTVKQSKIIHKKIFVCFDYDC